MPYATVEDLRDEGVPDDLTDVQLGRVIARQSAQIEAFTRRWFYPREMTLRLDGSGHEILQIGPPIISITEVKVLTPDYLVFPSNADVVDPTSYRVYNRHLTAGLTDPDDRNNPKIQYLSVWEGGMRAGAAYPGGWWPRGQQNIQIKGLFGYTDFDGGETLWTDGLTPVGKTPELVKLALLMLVARDTLPLSDVQGRVDAALAGNVASVRTRDQQITYNTSTKQSTSTSPSIMANAEVRNLLLKFCAPAALGAV